MTQRNTPLMTVFFPPLAFSSSSTKLPTCIHCDYPIRPTSPALEHACTHSAHTICGLHYHDFELGRPNLRKRESHKCVACGQAYILPEVGEKFILPTGHKYAKLGGSTEKGVRMVDRPEKICEWDFELQVAVYEDDIEGEELEVGDAVVQLMSEVQKRIGKSITFERVWKAVWAKSLGLEMERELALHGRMFWGARLTKTEIGEIRGIKMKKEEEEKKQKENEEELTAKLDTLNVSDSSGTTIVESADNTDSPKWIRLFEKKEEPMKEKTTKRNRRKKTAAAGPSQGGGRPVVGSDAWVEAQKDRKKRNAEADEVIW